MISLNSRSDRPRYSRYSFRSACGFGNRIRVGHCSTSVREISSLSASLGDCVSSTTKPFSFLTVLSAFLK